MSGKIIAIEGIDGSGKGTQSRRLVETLQSEGLTVTLLSFPRYSSTRFGAAIGEFLNGRFGDLDTVSPWLISVLYAGDRFESKAVIDEAVASNDLLLFDRYTSSNIAHQGAKVDATERDEIIRWIEEIEHNVFGLPRPDLNLLLDVSVETSQALIRKKAPRDYTDAAADLQESDVAYMSGVHACYQQLARRSDWQSIACETTDGVRSMDEIATEVREAIRSVL
ncbi:MAG: dTMP kinase [Planctomycetaceae bacterium]